MSQISNQGSAPTKNTVSRAVRIGASEVTEDVLCKVEGQFPGLLWLAFDKQTGNLTMVYDAANLTFSRILPRLAEAGIQPVASRWLRLKAAWYDYTDRNTASQARVKSNGCCSKR